MHCTHTLYSCTVPILYVRMTLYLHLGRAREITRGRSRRISTARRSGGGLLHLADLCVWQRQRGRCEYDASMHALMHLADLCVWQRQRGRVQFTHTLYSHTVNHTRITSQVRALLAADVGINVASRKRGQTAIYLAGEMMRLTRVE
jgi:hypothetical protein